MRQQVILGVHSMCYVPAFLEKDIPLLEKCYRMGARLFEIVPFNVDTFPAKLVGQAAADMGMKLTLGFGLPDWADPTSVSEHVRQQAFDLSRRVIDMAFECEALGLYGAIHQPWGKPTFPSRDGWQRSVEGMRRVADYALAADKDFRLGVETLNRFEASQNNTVEQVLEFIAAVDRPNVGVHADLFHMNIEERDIPAALKCAGNKLVYLHANENDRGQPGTGHIPWVQVFLSLRDICYSGPVVMESFNPDMTDVAGPTATWRRFAPTQDELVENGLRFLKSMCEEVGLEVAA